MFPCFLNRSMDSCAHGTTDEIRDVDSVLFGCSGSQNDLLDGLQQAGDGDIILFVLVVVIVMDGPDRHYDTDVFGIGNHASPTVTELAIA